MSSKDEPRSAEPGASLREVSLDHSPHADTTSGRSKRQVWRASPPVRIDSSDRNAADATRSTAASMRPVVSGERPTPIPLDTMTHARLAGRRPVVHGGKPTHLNEQPEKKV
jgi:hypothetical protein